MTANLCSSCRANFCHCGPAAIGPSRERLVGYRGHEHFGPIWPSWIACIVAAGLAWLGFAAG